MWQSGDLLTTLVRDLVAVDLNSGGDSELTEEVVNFVGERAAAMPTLTRTGFTAGGVCLDLWVRAHAGRRYPKLSDNERFEMLSRLDPKSRVPLLSEYVRAVRSLVLVKAYERIGSRGVPIETVRPG